MTHQLLSFLNYYGKKFNHSPRSESHLFLPSLCVKRDSALSSLPLHEARFFPSFSPSPRREIFLFLPSRGLKRDSSPPSLPLREERFFSFFSPSSRADNECERISSLPKVTMRLKSVSHQFRLCHFEISPSFQSKWMNWTLILSLRGWLYIFKDIPPFENAKKGTKLWKYSRNCKIREENGWRRNYIKIERNGLRFWTKSIDIHCFRLEIRHSW
jgi:hypothetical protein